MTFINLTSGAGGHLSISSRLKEERQRLGLSQTAFAALAGATKSVQIKWEGGASSAPTAPALAAFAEAGADVLYILTGRRTAERDEVTANAADHLASIRRDMLVSAWEPAAGEDEAAAEARVMRNRAEQLQAILQGKAGPLAADAAEEAESLLTIVSSPVQLAAFRAADLVQRRARRRRLRQQIEGYTDLGDYQPNEQALNTMVTIALDYGVPIAFLAELVYDIAASDPNWLEPLPSEGTAS